MKIAIIGGGVAGLASAWLLDEHHQVTLFEKEAQLGGHAGTMQVSIDGTYVPIDTGFELFSDALFPQFERLLQILNVPTRPFSLTYTFYRTDNAEIVCLPPFHDGVFSLKSFLPKQLFELVQFKIFIDEGKKIVDMQDRHTTMNQYLHSIAITEDFKKDFLLPFLASGWGVSCESFKNFAAYDILKWYAVSKPARFCDLVWKEVIGGVTTYIDVLRKQCLNTRIKTSSVISSISSSPSGYTIEEADGTRSTFDHLIVATNAREAIDLLKGLPQASVLTDSLKNISYVPTTIAIHSDERFMPTNPADWGVVNIAFDGITSAMTICKLWKSKTPLFRSWVTHHLAHREFLPDPLYALIHYEHAEVTPAYFQTQDTISSLQGANNLWLAGVYAIDIDSHESALQSAINVVQKLAPDSKRLQALLSR